MYTHTSGSKSFHFQQVLLICSYVFTVGFSQIPDLEVFIPPPPYLTVTESCLFVVHNALKPLTLFFICNVTTILHSVAS